MEKDKPIKIATEARIENIRQLSKDEIEGPPSSYIIAMANMSRRGAQIFQISVDGGKHWADIKPPLGSNCQYNTVPECNANNQWSEIATVNCGYLIVLAIRWRLPDGSEWQAQYQGNQIADCNTNKGVLYGFTD